GRTCRRHTVLERVLRSKESPMSVPVSPNAESPVPAPLYCPFCGRVLTLVVVNPAGELIGCEECAEDRGLAGDVLTIEEWNGPAERADVPAAFGWGGGPGRKPQPTAAEQPRAHYWEVLAGTSRYFLKRFYPWYPSSAIRHMHSMLAHLGAQQVPVPHWIAD